MSTDREFHFFYSERAAAPTAPPAIPCIQLFTRFRGRGVIIPGSGSHAPILSRTRHASTKRLRIRHTCRHRSLNTVSGSHWASAAKDQESRETSSLLTSQTTCGRRRRTRGESQRDTAHSKTGKKGRPGTASDTNEHLL